MGLSGHDAQAQQAPAFDFRGSSIPAGTHCPYRAVALGNPQILSLMSSEPGEFTPGYFGNNSLAL